MVPFRVDGHILLSEESSLLQSNVMEPLAGNLLWCSNLHIVEILTSIHVIPVESRVDNY